jgi:hypothetical protein
MSSTTVEGSRSAGGGQSRFLRPTPHCASYEQLVSFESARECDVCDSQVPFLCRPFTGSLAKKAAVCGD